MEKTKICPNGFHSNRDSECDCGSKPSPSVIESEDTCPHGSTDCNLCLPPQTEEVEDWVKDWSKFCEEQANGFDRFTPLQRSGIAGIYEILGKTFIRNLLSSNTERVKGEIIKQVGENLWTEDAGNSVIEFEDFKDIINKIK